MPEPTTTTTSPASPASALSRLKIDRGGGTSRRPRRPRWLLWIGGAAVVIVLALLLFGPRKLEVQTTSVVTTYASQQYAQLTASGYVVAQRRAAVASKATGRLL